MWRETWVPACAGATGLCGEGGGSGIEIVIEIPPFGIEAPDQVELPGALPPLDRLLPGDRLVDALMAFDINQQRQPVLPAEI